MDYGVVGLEDTLDALDAASVRRIGAGHSASEAARPVVIEASGLRVAFIGCVATPGRRAPIEQWAAATAGVSSADAALQPGSQRKQLADFVVVWRAGSTTRRTPQARIVNTVLLGDVFIGHHSRGAAGRLRGGQLVAGTRPFIFDPTALIGEHPGAACHWSFG
jgi:poly-gamma-glutamate synthesis protein (capsule biosynthesis protein)